MSADVLEVIRILDEAECPMDNRMLWWFDEESGEWELYTNKDECTQQGER